MLAISSSAFARGFGGGGGHFGGGGFGGGHFGGGHVGAGHFGGHYGWHGGHGYGGHWYGGGFYPYYGGWGYPYGDSYYGDGYGYYDGSDAYVDNAAPDTGTIVAAQKELAKLGYYHGSIDGVVGPETEKAVRWFQSVDKIPVTGELDDQTLQALQIG